MDNSQREWPVKAKGLTFDPFKGRIMLYKSTVEALGSPEYIRFLFNPLKKRFAVQVCSIKDDGAERMPKLGEGDNCYICCVALVRYVFNACNWNSKYTHRVEGVPYPDEKLIDYDLTQFWKVRWEEIEEPQ